jgi:ABC-2 type transport system permease protein
MFGKIKLIALREYLTRVRQRSFQISTAIQLIGVLVLAFVPVIITAFSGSSTSTARIAVIDTSGANVVQQMRPYIERIEAGETADNGAIALVSQSVSSDEARNEVKNGDLHAALFVERNAAGNLAFSYVNKDGTADSESQIIYAAASAIALQDRLERSGLSAAQARQVATQPAFAVTSAEPKSDTATEDAEKGAKMAIGYLLSFMMYMVVIVYGMWIAGGVVEEKASRIMEIMINAATPWQLMAGKVIGIGLAAMTQVVPTVVLGAVAFSLQGKITKQALDKTSSLSGIDFSAIGMQAAIAFLVYFILGFLLYAALYAGVGSLVSRQEEINQAVMPLTFVVMIGFFGAMFVVFGKPDSVVAQVLSIIPFTAPMTMLPRILVGHPPAWEIALSVALLIAAVAGAIAFAGRLYRMGVLMYGQKPSLRLLFNMNSTAKVAR